MKTGIVTLALKTNYGGLLQAYALQTVLKGLGHDAVTFEYDNRLRYRGPILKYPLALLKRFVKKYVMGRGGYVFIESELNRRYRMSSQYTEKFIINNITTRKVRSLDEVKEGEYECFVVGSDQVWRPKYSFDLYNSYLLFAENWNVRKLAYAASFGTDEWEYTDEQTKICQRLARKFSMVSVREASGIGLCGMAGIPVTHRGASRGFHVITGHTADNLPPEIEEIRWKSYAKLDETFVFLMGLKSIDMITEKLMRYGKLSDTPVAVIHGENTDGTYVKLVGTLSDIAAKVKEVDFPSPAIIVVGEVASLELTD